ncbi:hypothetical protein VTK73DRAFT_4891 [Phialemonium thermophilum]|uniref:Holocytochrome c-type synthase n=1 Tax=Phialemonium thermophilum TaxID=223376 RepID=A0ABR3WR37_9PEZI
MNLDLLDTILVTQKDSSAEQSAGGSASTINVDTKSASSATVSRSRLAAPSPSAIMSNHGGTSAADDSAEAKCPVDHKTREIWLAQARAAAAAGGSVVPPHPLPPSAPQPHPNTPAASTPSASPSDAVPSKPTGWGWRIPFWGSSTPAEPTQNASSRQHPQPSAPPAHLSLDTTRQVSSIPRTPTAKGPGASLDDPSSTIATTTGTAAGAASHASRSSGTPANHEMETAADPATGNWIYPSERMFFEAMRRKGFTHTQAADMRTVVPIHNAVNERAWAEIRRWEAPYVAPRGSCGGPRLDSFAGLSERMTPRARLNTLLGYAAPFDRHDWVVDRCGTRVEYVIDFYAGRSDGGDAQGKVNFYLDVRPKLNSWEGIRMRVSRALGLV